MATPGDLVVSERLEEAQQQRDSFDDQLDSDLGSEDDQRSMSDEGGNAGG